MNRRLSSWLLSTFVGMTLAWAFVEALGRMMDSPPWACSTDAECERLRDYVDAHRGWMLP